MIFARRSKPSLEHLEWRIRLFGVGAILAMVGIWSGQGWLINLAIGVLVIGFALRFLRRREGDEGTRADSDDEAAT